MATILRSQATTALIADASPTICKIVQKVLHREHIRVITVSDGLSVLSCIADERPDIILLDSKLPQMDGYQVCQILRKNLQLQHTPVILLGKKNGLFEKIRRYIVQPNAYLIKPFDASELIQPSKSAWRELNNYP